VFKKELNNGIPNVTVWRVLQNSSHELWGCASKSNISIIQRSQSKILRIIVDAPWYVSKGTLHADLGISYIQDAIHQKCNKHQTRLGTHENPLLRTLLVREENRRLKRNWPIDLI
jgi:hypothetical protein